LRLLRNNPNMQSRESVVDIELGRPIADFEGLDGYGSLRGLVRIHGAPIGSVSLPVAGGRCPAVAALEAILDQLGPTLAQRLLNFALASPGGSSLADLADARPSARSGPLPPVTVAVCTRDRTDDLVRCLDSLSRLDYPHLDLLVVDNAPSSDATERLVRESYPSVRYVLEPRPGLDWARNRAIEAARGEIIAYTDDDVVVDSGWVRALALVFAEDADVMAVTGLVVPSELETEAQLLFERYGGFGRGFERRWYRVDPRGGRYATVHLGAGRFGTGANMAYRLDVFDRIGPFDPALDVGTPTNGGGDLEMFFRVLQEGYMLVYEPGAIVRHRHRRDYRQLRSQITNNGIGLFSYFVRSASAYKDRRLAFIRLGLWWLWWWNVRRLLKSLADPAFFPRDLILAELWGCLVGLSRYRKARRMAAEVAASHGPPMSAPPNRASPLCPAEPFGAIAVRTVDLSRPVTSLDDVSDYSRTCVVILRDTRPLGTLEIVNHRRPINAARLIDAIVDHFGPKLLAPDQDRFRATLPADVMAALRRRFLRGAREEVLGDAPPRLPADIAVSVVVATFDRPDELRNCLHCLVAQDSPRPVEIIVVDNNPASGLTPPVVAEFAGVALVGEPRQGLSYARNAGIAASRGDIIIASDDDVTMPSGWLEELVAPFARPDVMVVTGNILPLELETAAQQLFEIYGGLGRGFEPRVYGRDWFRRFRSAVPTWLLGATANAAFRTSLVGDPRIGLMDEALGPGTPTGVGEDTYLFYKVLKAGGIIVYEPSAYVWHKHRRDLPSLCRQLYNYSKGHVAYHLTTVLRDHDPRALVHLVLGLPSFHAKWAAARLLGKSDYPLSLLALEIAGNLAGPWSLWRSRRRIRCDGRSDPYLPVSERPATPPAPATGADGPLATRRAVRAPAGEAEVAWSVPRPVGIAGTTSSAQSPEPHDCTKEGGS